MTTLRGLLGRKLGMTRVFNSQGQAVAVTVVEVGPCTVIQKKTREHDGYNALQIGFSPKRFSRMTRPEQGHVKKAGLEYGFYHVEEFPVEDPGSYELGQVITLQEFGNLTFVDVRGVTKGHGFTGTVKRYGFHRGKMTHGSKCHREMGSVGQSAYPSRVIKGKRMPGRMGGVQCTVKNTLVVDVRHEDNLLLLKGAVPGPANQVVSIRCK